ncbi:transglycosylase SLT domain-containing protein [Arsukibacterium sp.]|uniref:transglycosylase SLT domain-containing protein n=1 Tax=Arsukibacterium sp. TaxID=1977258 RepID=UPI002FD89551
MRTTIRQLGRFFIGSLFFSAALPLNASETRVSGQAETTAFSAEQRQLFQQAERQVGSASQAEVQQWLEQLSGYPLQPYLEQRWLLRRLSAHAEIEAFLATYQGTPLDWSLRRPWLQHLAAQQQGKRYLANYPGSFDAELECLALRFQLAEASDKAPIWQQTQALWTVGKSQPKACDPLFSAWRNAGQLTDEIVLRRIQLAAEGGQAGLIPYLKTLLPASQHYLADMWANARRNPAAIAQTRFFPMKHIAERDVLAYGLKRLVWRLPDQALSTWQRYVNDPYFTPAQRLDVQRQFAIALASKGDSRASDWLSTLPPEFYDNNLAQWQVGFALRQLDWPQVQQVINSFPEELQRDVNWRYWLARSLQMQGQAEQAEAIFQEVAKRRHFYGFMAAARLGLPPSLAHNPVSVSEQQLSQLKANPVIQRAQEWLALGRLTEARREWNQLQDLSDQEQKLALARLAQQLEWHERAIFSLADVGYWDDVELRFPLAFVEDIQRSSDKANIAAAWAMAIARRESSFMTDANSPVGARGLMQIMPTTANYIARQPVTVRQLYNPVTNIDYGTDYLNYLMRRNDGNLITATAAYNAGFSRVRQWIPRDHALPVDVWIETIPFRETREYVKAVMAYYQIYNIRMNIAEDVFSPLITMQIGVVVE